MKSHDRVPRNKVMETMTRLCVIVVVMITEATAATLSQMRTEIINQLLNNTLMGEYMPPGYETNTPLVVKIGMYIHNFDAISDSNMDYEMTLTLKLSWVDDRLKYQKLPNRDRLELEEEVMKKMWFPDVYFLNGKHANFHHVTVPNTMMDIYPNGKVFSAVKITTILRCDMDLTKFPFDTQTCNAKLGSYAYGTHYFVLKWFKKGIELEPNIHLPRFYLTEYKPDRCPSYDPGIHEVFDCVIAVLRLERAYGYFLRDIYIPSTLVVILSWVTFWLDVEAVPARVTLGLLTVLTMTTQGANSGSELPRISAVKAIDVWIATCLLFVFGALMEFAYVNVSAHLDDWFMFCGQVQYDSLQDIIGSFASTEYGNLPPPPPVEQEIPPPPVFHVDEIETNVDDATVILEPGETGIKTDDSKEYSVGDFFDKPDKSNAGAGLLLTTRSIVSREKQQSIVVEPDNATSRRTSDLTFQRRSFSVTLEMLRDVEDESSLEESRHIDRISRIVFPILFGLFNLVYWITYLTD